MLLMRRVVRDSQPGALAPGRARTRANQKYGIRQQDSECLAWSPGPTVMPLIQAHGRQIMNMDTKIGKRISLDIDREEIRCSHSDPKHEFLPADLSLVDRLPFLAPEVRGLLSRIQERTYANM